MHADSTSHVLDINHSRREATETDWSLRFVWITQIVVAIILAQTLFFKFTYAPETQVIFASRGGRPMATAIGVIELISAILLLTTRGAIGGAILSLAIETEADLNARDDRGNSPLHLAALNLDAGTEARLVKAGANPNATNKWGDTPLIYSASSLENVQLLV